MRDEKRVVTLNDYEQRLLVRGLTDFRNDALRDGVPTEDVDDLILKVIDAPTSSSRTSQRLFPRKREKRAHSVAPPLPTKSSDSARTPSKKRRSDREAR